jgi:hypothetical protein
MTTLSRALAIIDEGDFCWTTLLIAIFLGVGSRMIERRPDLQALGLRLSAIAFVAYLVYGAVRFEPMAAEGWVGIALRGLSAGGLTLGLAWIALALLAALGHHTILRPLAALRRWLTAARVRRAMRRARRDADRAAAIRQAELERTAPERELARQRQLEEQRLAMQRAEEQARERERAQTRREDARASALLSFTFYSAKLGSRFSRKDYDHYLATYMGDNQSPEAVERRGKELVAIFERHLADAKPAKQETSIDSLTRWYADTKAQIEGLPIPEDIKEERLIELETRFAELLAEHMERSRP